MRILLIEDHHDIAANIAEYFAAKGDIVTIAATGIEGLNLAQQAHVSDIAAFDAIVLDLMLPDLDGLNVCQQLRTTDAPQIPILMLTARDLLTDKVAGLDAGADDYLVKPFSLLELAARLRALTRRSFQGDPRVLCVADLQYDLQTLVAQRAGRIIKLNPTTRRILQLLLQNNHRVVTRSELEQHLWQDDPPGPDVLRAHMHALRNAIDKDSDCKLLHTLHGTGYRLTDAKTVES
jgi:DNA-binding response OmpR family regulator